MRIAVDAMGGDHAPEEIVPGALAAAKIIDAEICLVGDQQQIIDLLGGAYKGTGAGGVADVGPGRVTVRHSEGVVGMDESPRAALKRGRNSSVADCIEMVKSGEAGAAISAGNSGAVMALATMRLRNIADVDRAAIATMLPTKRGNIIMLDAGANADCRPENLVEFAIMGSCYARHAFGVSEPRVGILNIGEETKKGNALVQAAYSLLQSAPINFVGHIEGNHAFDGDIDVIVCDGFVGNVVLKVLEGSVGLVSHILKDGIRTSWLSKIGALLMKPAFNHLRRRCDWAEYGGALLLGINGVCIVSHGRSDRRAVSKAIQVAANAVKHDVIGEMTHSLKQL